MFGYNQPIFNYGAGYAPVTRPAETMQGYPQIQNVAPAQSVGQGQGISPVSRPVSSKEEAMAVGADFSGAPMVFPNMALNEIYVKRWDLQTGTAIFTEYVPKKAEADAPPALYATQGDFRELAEKLTERLEDIEADIERLKKKGAKKNDDE